MLLTCTDIHKMKIPNIVRYISDISLRVFVTKSLRSACYTSNSRLAWAINRWNERTVARYLQREVDKCDLDFPGLLGRPNPDVPEKSIFIMWWQGERNAPPLVKACIDSVRVHAAGHKVIVVSEQNIGEFVTIPSFITDKVRSGVISFTHLSDIIRLNLLTLYGGAWIDATVFCARDIPERLFLSPFYSIHFGKFTKDPSHGRWTTFLMFACKDSQIIKKTLDFHYRYWSRHNVILDYIMFDYLINEVISQDKNLADVVNSIPIENENVFELMKHIGDDGFDLKRFVGNSSTIFYKLSWKRKFNNPGRVVEMLVEMNKGGLR